MATSRANWLVAALLAGGAALSAQPGTGSVQIDGSQPIQLDATSSNFDYKNNSLTFEGVRIVQGGLSVEADEATATGLDFKDSRWVFRGKVRITMPDGSLSSDEARINFVGNLISTAVITGSPARFEQKRDKGIARGRAARIEYEPGAGIVRLADDAWLSEGNNEISGRTLVYNMRDQKVLADADQQGTQRVRITINPKTPDAKPDGSHEP